MTRDLTKKQFELACKRHGFTKSGFMGYYDLGIPGKHIECSIWNAGDRRREQLAYLLKMRESNENLIEKGII